MSVENWKPVVGYERLYEVSDFGRVRSLGRVDALGRSRLPKFLKPCRDGRRRLRVVLYAVDGVKKRSFVHCLVLEAFVSLRPDHQEACHYPDRDPSNCHLSNLRWDTRKANHADKLKHGTSMHGARHWMRKHGAPVMDAHKVARVFALQAAGNSQRKIAAATGTCQQNVSKILTGKTWAHVGGKAT